MKQTPLKRGKDLARGPWRRKAAAPIGLRRDGAGGFVLVAAPLKRGKGLPSRTKDRGRAARTRLRQHGTEPFIAWLHAQPCQVAGQIGSPVCGWVGERRAIEECHVRSRGAGHGVYTTDTDVPNVFSGCPRHHDWSAVRPWLVPALFTIAARQRRQFEARR